MQIDLESDSLPFADQSFVLVNFSNVLEQLYYRKGILTDIKCVKKEDGLAVLSVPNADITWKKILESVGLDSKDDSDHKIEYSKQSLIEELQIVDSQICSDLVPIIPRFPWMVLLP